jgi:hypothetical protein
LRLSPEPCHHVDGFERHPPVSPASSIEGEQGMIGRQHADSDADLIAPLGHVIEVGDQMGQLDRVVKRQQVSQRTEPDPLRFRSQ